LQKKFVEANGVVYSDKKATESRYAAIVQNVFASDDFKAACKAKGNCAITMDDSTIKALDDGFTLHCGHLSLYQEKNGSSKVVEHRFTMVYNDQGKLVHSQISKNPENPDGVVVAPRVGGVFQPSSSANKSL
jgi:hypothetical protein